MKRLKTSAVMVALLLVAVAFSGSQPLTKTPVKEFVTLFNGKDLSGWYTFLRDEGKDNDPEGVFQVKNGELLISGKEFGYISTVKEYENYHLSLEFKWGVAKHPPRENAKRDSGICYHFPAESEDNVWPMSIECQIQEGDCGDFWLIGGATIEASRLEDHPEWGLKRYFKSIDNENPSGEWNTVEVITQNGNCQHLVNGEVVNEGTQASLRKGRIVLQSEGAEIYYRNIRIKQL